MPNEEPEGPTLPPRKKSNLLRIETKDNVNQVEFKGILASIAAGIVLISYIVYCYHYYNSGEKLNELYFISTGIGISIFTGLLFTFFRNVYIRTILLFTCVFYAILEVIYIIMWIFFENPYAYLKQALIAGLIIGLIYFIYDRIKYNSRVGN